MKLHAALCCDLAPSPFSHGNTRKPLLGLSGAQHKSWSSPVALCHTVRPTVHVCPVTAGHPFFQHACMAAHQPSIHAGQQLSAYITPLRVCGTCSLGSAQYSTQGSSRQATVRAMPSDANSCSNLSDSSKQQGVKNKGSGSHGTDFSTGSEQDMPDTGKSKSTARRETAGVSKGAATGSKQSSKRYVRGHDRTTSHSSNNAGKQHNTGQDSSDEAPGLDNRRSITTMQQLLVCVRRQQAPLSHAAVGQVCTLLNRLLQKHQRAQQVARTAQRRAHRAYTYPNAVVTDADLVPMASLPPTPTTAPPSLPHVASPTPSATPIMSQQSLRSQAALPLPQAAPAPVAAATPAQTSPDSQSTTTSSASTTMSSSSTSKTAAGAATPDATGTAGQQLTQRPTRPTAVPSIPLSETAGQISEDEKVAGHTPAGLRQVAVPSPGLLQLTQHRETATIMYQAQQVLQHVLQICQPLDTCTDASAACHLIEAMGAVGYQQACPKQVAGLLQALQPMLPQLPSHVMAKLLWGLGRLQHRPTVEWMEVAVGVCAVRSTSLGTWTTATMLEGLAKLQALAATGPDVSSSTAGSLSTVPDAVQDAVRRLQPHIAWLTPGQLACLLFSMANIGVKPHITWLKDFEQRSSSKLPGLTVVQAAQLAAALLKLRYVPSKWWLHHFWKYSLEAMRFAGVPYDFVYDSNSTRGSSTGSGCSTGSSDLSTGSNSSHGKASQLSSNRDSDRSDGSINTAIQGQGPAVSSTACSGAARRNRRGGVHAVTRDQQQDDSGMPADDLQAFLHDAVMCDITHVLEVASSLGRLNLDLPKPWAHHALAVVRGLPPPLPQTVPRAPYVRGMPRSARGHVVSSVTAPLPPAVSQSLQRSESKSSPGRPVALIDRGGLGQFKVQLSPVQAVQAVYVVAKYRDSSAVARHVSWARKLLRQLLRDLNAIQNGSWSVPPGQRGQMRVQHAHQQHTDQEPAPSVRGQRAVIRPTVKAQQAVQVASIKSTPMAEQSVQTGVNLSAYTQSLVDVLYACAELREAPPADRMTALLQDLQQVLPTTSTAQCATIMVCLAVLRFTPTQPWCSSFFHHMHSQLQGFSAQELANTLTAAAYLGLDPGGDMLAAVHQVIRTYSLVQLAMLVRKLQAAPPAVAQQAAWLASLQADSTRLLSSMSR